MTWVANRPNHLTFMTSLIYGDQEVDQDYSLVASIYRQFNVFCWSAARGTPPDPKLLRPRLVWSALPTWLASPCPRYFTGWMLAACLASQPNQSPGQLLGRVKRYKNKFANHYAWLKSHVPFKTLPLSPLGQQLRPLTRIGFVCLEQPNQSRFPLLPSTISLLAFVYHLTSSLFRYLCPTI